MPSKKKSPPTIPVPPAPKPPRPERVWVEFNEQIGLSELKADTPVRVEANVPFGDLDPQRYHHGSLGDVAQHLENFHDEFEVYNGSRWVKACRTEPPKLLHVTMTFEVMTRAHTVEDSAGAEIAEMVRKEYLTRDPRGVYNILSIQEIYAPSETKKG